MTRLFTDRYGLNLLLTVLFILGIGASLYFIYSLPTGLQLSDGYQPEFVPVYLVTGCTFLLGLLSLIWALRYKKEVLVFRDKIIDTAQAEKEAAEQAGRTTISLDGVKTALTQPDEKESFQDALQSICKQLEAGQGALYKTDTTGEKRMATLYCGYALNMGESNVISFEFGEGLVGQVAATGQALYIDDVPDGYITVLSGLGSSSPSYMLLIPIKNKEQVSGVLEIASFTNTTEDQRKFVEEAAHLIGEKLSPKGGQQV
ncbi:MAG TPA: GAF domain-containing protein [Ohtaekwangia sp.]|nr:GAF domain-containing protein [Ohtaekwangia sp.]